MNSIRENGYQDIYLPARKKKKKLLYADILFSLCLFLEGGVLLQVYFNESVSGT